VFNLLKKTDYVICW